MRQVFNAAASLKDYSFESYETVPRFVSYWYQLKLILEESPSSVLEIGKGTGLVSSYLRGMVERVNTFDVNPALKPDFVGDLFSLENSIGCLKYDIVLCARVLHHIPFERFYEAIDCLLEASESKLIVSIPVNDWRVYFLARVTGSGFRALSVRAPRFTKEVIKKFVRRKTGSGLWMINDGSAPTKKSLLKSLNKKYNLVNFSSPPLEQSHLFFVLRK